MWYQKLNKMSVRFVQRFSGLRCKSSLSCKLVSSDKPTLTVKYIHEVKPVDSSFIVQGWVKNIRKQKKYTFIDFNDGSHSKVLQMIIQTNCLPKGLIIGSVIAAEGELKVSTHPKQPIEFVSDKIVVTGSFDCDTYPIAPEDRDMLRCNRSFLYLRPRNETFQSILKIRNCATMKIHQYFQDNGYYLIHTPVLTSNDAEGAGNIFKVVTLQNSTESAIGENSDDDETDVENDRSEESLPKKHIELFDSDIFLTVTGQLQLESIICGGLPKVYSFGPIFRSENQRSRNHLTEFYMVEAEIAFIHSLEDVLQLIENMIRSTCNAVYEACAGDIDVVERYIERQVSEHVYQLVNKRFIRITYTEAIQLLNEKSTKLKAPLIWGDKLQRGHEMEIVRLCGNVPVFVTNYPSAIKAFYMKTTEGEPNTVEAVDLLVPEIGELCGGSLREDSVDVLEAKMKEANLKGSMQWYLDLRRFGSVPHGGFGLGFERLLRLITGMSNVKETIPFPRWPHHCET